MKNEPLKKENVFSLSGIVGMELVKSPLDGILNNQRTVNSGFNSVDWGEKEIEAYSDLIRGIFEAENWSFTCQGDGVSAKESVLPLGLMPIFLVEVSKWIKEISGKCIDIPLQEDDVALCLGRVCEGKKLPTPVVAAMFTHFSMERRYEAQHNIHHLKVKKEDRKPIDLNDLYEAFILGWSENKIEHKPKEFKTYRQTQQ